jgi:hypothetical protein
MVPNALGSLPLSYPQLSSLTARKGTFITSLPGASIVYAAMVMFNIQVPSFGRRRLTGKRSQLIQRG